MLALLLCLSVPSPEQPAILVNATGLPVADMARLHDRRGCCTAEIVSSTSWGGLVELDHPGPNLTVTAVAEAEPGATVTVKGTLLFLRHPASSEAWICLAMTHQMALQMMPAREPGNHLRRM
jgi:hypothetical protein